MDKWKEDLWSLRFQVRQSRTGENVEIVCLDFQGDTAKDYHMVMFHCAYVSVITSKS